MAAADEIVASLLADSSKNESSDDSSDEPIVDAALADFSSAVRAGKTRQARAALRLVIKNMLSEEGSQE